MSSSSRSSSASEKAKRPDHTKDFVNAVVESAKKQGETFDKDCERTRSLCGFVLSAAFIGITIATATTPGTPDGDAGCVIPAWMLSDDMRSLYFDCAFFFGGFSFLLGFLGVLIGSVMSDFNGRAFSEEPARLSGTWGWVTEYGSPSAEDAIIVWGGMTRRIRAADATMRTLIGVAHAVSFLAFVSLSATLILLCWTRVQSCAVILAFTVMLATLTVTAILWHVVPYTAKYGCLCRCCAPCCATMMEAFRSFDDLHWANEHLQQLPATMKERFLDGPANAEFEVTLRQLVANANTGFNNAPHENDGSDGSYGTSQYGSYS